MQSAVDTAYKKAATKAPAPIKEPATFMVGAAALPELLPVGLELEPDPDPEREALGPVGELVAAPLPLAPEPLAVAGAPRMTVVELAAETVMTVVELVPGMPWVRVWMPLVPTAGMVMEGGREVTAGGWLEMAAG